MPFVQGTCPNCGGTLAVDNSKDAAICNYCNTPFIVEKAINQFNINNVSNMNVAHMQVNVASGKESIEEKYNACIKLINGSDWNNARRIADTMIKDFQSDYRGYWCMVLIESRNFSIRPIPTTIYDVRGHAIKVASDIPDVVWNNYRMVRELIPNQDMFKEYESQFEAFRNLFDAKGKEVQNNIENEKKQKNKEDWKGVMKLAFVCIIMLLIIFILENI